MALRKRWTSLNLLAFTSSLEGSYFETPPTLKPLHINFDLCREPVKVLNTLNEFKRNVKLHLRISSTDALCTPCKG
jgi:hypothetical protein